MMMIRTKTTTMMMMMMVIEGFSDFLEKRVCKLLCKIGLTDLKLIFCRFYITYLLDFLVVAEFLFLLSL